MISKNGSGAGLDGDLEVKSDHTNSDVFSTLLGTWKPTAACLI